MRRFLVVGALASAACSPQNAEITSGTYTAFLSDSTSLVVIEDKVRIGEGGEYTRVDCRQLEDEDDLLADRNPDLCSVTDDAGVPVWPMEHELWANRDGFHVWTVDLEPWRGEAIMTMEDDLQLTFHQRIPGGEDFRFAFVIDPFFQPTRCVQDENGNVQREEIDGNWLDNWSADVGSEFFSGSGTDGYLYFLNSGAYQFNPYDTSEFWSLPERWRAGYARGRFGPEDLFTRKTRYGLPSAYSAFELDDYVEPAPADMFYTNMEPGTDPTTSSGFQSQINRVRDVAGEIRSEFEGLGAPEGAVLQPLVHTNEWRAPDGRAAGLDGWVALEYNWVRLDQDPATLAPGQPVSGEMMLVFDADLSQSRIVVRAEFSVEKIAKDRWTTDRIDLQKLEENETNLCGEQYGQDE